MRSSRGRSEFADLAGLALAVIGLAIASGHSADAEDTSADPRLTCFVNAARDPILPTDLVAFKGSEAWATVGINRKFGGVAVSLSLTHPSVPDISLDVLQAR